ncbi:hypothetical protein [Desulfurococcus amylolyticus]|uniref:hypothetical protein n=1 Tax=Desulfurococcus TaxID=2273 RepID=UPI0012FEB30A|nr:hypothetical protein [Desulfurococcus amylolyticus]
MTSCPPSSLYAAYEGLPPLRRWRTPSGGLLASLIEFITASSIPAYNNKYLTAF